MPKLYGYFKVSLAPANGKLSHSQFVHQMNRPVSQSFFDLCDEDLDFFRLPILNSNQQAKECGLQELLEVYPENTADLFLGLGQPCPFSM